MLKTLRLHVHMHAKVSCTLRKRKTMKHINKKKINQQQQIRTCWWWARAAIWRCSRRRRPPAHWGPRLLALHWWWPSPVWSRWPAPAAAEWWHHEASSQSAGRREGGQTLYGVKQHDSYIMRSACEWRRNARRTGSVMVSWRNGWITHFHLFIFTHEICFLFSSFLRIIFLKSLCWATYCWSTETWQLF